jgi:hypothetical protein
MSLWLLDQGYYYKLLLASVRSSEEIEHTVKEIVRDMVKDEPLTHALTSAVSRVTSSRMANIFYGLQTAIAALMLISALFYVPPNRTEPASAPSITAIGDLRGR